MGTDAVPQGVTQVDHQPIARVTGLFIWRAGSLESLTEETVIRPAEIAWHPIFYKLELHPAQGDENLIIDLIYDGLSPIRLDDMRRGTDVPYGALHWMDWFEIPPYDEMHDVDGRVVHPRAPGVHTVRIRCGRRKWAQMGRVRDFSQDNGGSMSEEFRIRIGEG